MSTRCYSKNNKTTVSSHNYFLLKNTLIFIQDMLLYDKIRMKDIPLKIRIVETSLYIAALRISRDISEERYIQDLELLKNDISYIHNRQRRSFQQLYDGSLIFISNNIRMKE